MKLIISGDCGISASDEVEKAKKLGIDFIITDHHKPPADLPDAVSILNPHLPDCKYPGKEITGVGVLFNLAIALRRALREEGYFGENEPNLGDYLDLVALGTVADCAPLINVNRILVKEGIKRISSSKRLGIKALKKVSSLNGEVDSFDIGFKLGPRINAVGRLSNADEAIELFITDEMEKALEIASRLNIENSNRQNIEKSIFEDVTNLIKSEPDLYNSNSIVLSSTEWHPGVIGIVASRIVDMFNKPTFLIAVGEDGIGKGSGRGTGGINLFNILSEIGELFEQFGGHELAAGITIKEKNIELFRKNFSSVLSKYENDITRSITVDCKVSFSDVSIELLDEFGILEPFGIGNPRPLFLEETLELVSTKIMKEKHLGLKLEKNGSVFNAIWFNFKELPELNSKLDVLYTPEINNWNGRREIRFNIRDISVR